MLQRIQILTDMRIRISPTRHISLLRLRCERRVTMGFYVTSDGEPLRKPTRLEFARADVVLRASRRHKCGS